MNVYVAASLNNAEAALRAVIKIMDCGMRVTSRWLRHDFSDRPAGGQQLREYEAAWAANDLADLALADALLLLSDVPSSTGGFHVELGYFLGRPKRPGAVHGSIALVGPAPNVFFRASGIKTFKDVAGAIEWLQSRHAEEPAKV